MLIWTKVYEPNQPFLLDSCWDSEEEYQRWKGKSQTKAETGRDARTDGLSQPVY